MQFAQRLALARLAVYLNLCLPFRLAVNLTVWLPSLAPMLAFGEANGQGDKKTKEIKKKG